MLIVLRDNLHFRLSYKKIMIRFHNPFSKGHRQGSRPLSMQWRQGRPGFLFDLRVAARALAWTRKHQCQAQISQNTATAVPPISKNRRSCDTYPLPAAWLFGNICNTAPGGRPRNTELWCTLEGRETWARWPAGETPPLGWRRTAGCFDNLSPWKWSCCTYTEGSLVY